MSESTLKFIDLDTCLGDLLQAPHWYVGFSGGVDSTVLLHLLHSWCRVQPRAPALSAVHVNHGLQAEAAQWQAHCRQQCQHLGIPLVECAVEVRNISGSVEDAARHARYRAFEDLLQPGAVLFLGHHLDDQVETFFLRLLRGAGLEGLAAIPSRRSLGQGELVRPLLEVARNDIEDYAREHGLCHVEDPSNSDLDMDRNFLRSRLMPVLAERWPSYRRTVSRASDHLAVAAGVLRETLGVPETLYSVMGDPGLSLSELLEGTDSVAALGLRAWLQVRGLQVPDKGSLEEFLRQLRSAAADARPQLVCRSYGLQRYGQALYLLPRLASPPSAEISLQPGEERDVPGVGRISLRPAAAEGLAIVEGGALTLAWRRGGERCRPRGRSAGTGLKKLLQEWHVPPWWRDRVPLFYLGDELLAVGDLALCDTSCFRAFATADEQLWSPVWERPESGVDD